MFDKSKLNSRVTALENEVKDMRRCIRQAECPHETVDFIVSDAPATLMSFPWSKKCRDCGKLLDFYKTRSEKYAAEIQHHEEKLKALKEKRDATSPKHETS